MLCWSEVAVKAAGANEKRKKIKHMKQCESTQFDLMTTHVNKMWLMGQFEFNFIDLYLQFLGLYREKEKNTK